MRYVCEFSGGPHHGRVIPLEEAEAMTPRRSPNRERERAAGRLTTRAELDDRPVFDGYAGPMWNGFCYNGRREYEIDAEERRKTEPVGILRYEAPAVYYKNSD